jgi:glycosyltransferase involved in cell wall biosynthesis
MKEQFNVDVALITKNHELYIEDAVEALLDQTLPIKRINIVDDASTDLTNSILKKLAKKSKIINLITNNASVGPSRASNMALRDLTGDFILYTSGDDISTSNRVEIQTKILLENPKFKAVLNQVDLLIHSRNISANQIPNFRTSIKTGFDLFNELYWEQNFLNSSAACFRRTSNERISFDENYLHLQDFKLWLELSLRNEIIVCPEVVLKYRVISTSLSQKINQNELYVNDSNEELYRLYCYFFDKLSLNNIIEIFGSFINEFKKVDEPIVNKKNLIDFLLLSHNNSYLQRKVFDNFFRNSLNSQNRDDSFFVFINTFFAAIDINEFRNNYFHYK